MGKSALLDAAEKEADEAESEFEAMSEEERAEVASEPGEQGIATQDEDEFDEAPSVWDRSPSQEEIAFANDELLRLEEFAQDMGADAVVDALMRVVDVHPKVQMPHSWTGGEASLAEAPFLADIGRFLCRGCPKIEISGDRVVFLWKNKKTWTRKGVQIRAQGKKLADVTSFFARGARAVVMGNFQLYKLLNTRQKIAAVYHALRSLGAEGDSIPNQFEGFFDEIELFGTGTFQTDTLLRRAIEHGDQRELPFEEALSVLFDGEDQEEHATLEAAAD